MVLFLRITFKLACLTYKLLTTSNLLICTRYFTPLAALYIPLLLLLLVCVS